MDTTEYKNKILSLLKDKNTYSTIATDPTNKFQILNNKLIANLKNKNIIDKDLERDLKIHNSLPPKIYGLPKLHKRDTPLRPITACIQSPFYSLSKYVSGILSNIVGKSQYHIKDSWIFADFRKN